MQRDDYSATFIVMFGLAAATLSGFARQAALAHQLGAGRAADIYLVAFAVPEFMFVALPIILPPAFIPLFAECRLRAGERAAWHFGVNVATALLVMLLLFILVAIAAAPVYMVWLSPGFDRLERVRAIQAARLMLPAMAFMGLSALAGAALQVYRRFARPALATAVYNLTFILVLMLAPVESAVTRACWGVLAGAIAMLAFQLPLVWRHRPAPTEERTANCPSVREVVWLAAPLAAGYSVHHLILFIDRAMATALGAGSAATLNYAYHLALATGQLSGLAVSTAIFPHLSEQIAQGNTAGARLSLAAALRFVWLIGLPVTCGLLVLRAPLVHLVFERGAFDQQATLAVSGPLAWYALAVLADALCQPVWRIVYAQRAMWLVVAVNGLQTLIRLGCNVAFRGLFGYNALAISAAVGLSVQALILGWIARRKLGPFVTAAWRRDILFITLAAIIATTGAWLVNLVMTTPATRLLLSSTVGGGSYLLILWFGNKQHRDAALRIFGSVRFWRQP